MLCVVQPVQRQDVHKILAELAAEGLIMVDRGTNLIRRLVNEHSAGAAM